VYACFAALSSNVSDTASCSTRSRLELFLDDNDNNHQNFDVLCNSDAAMKRLMQDAEANRARFGLTAR
jgi:hypothetical protein